MSNASDGHGTLIARAPAATPNTFTTIGELKVITPPPMSRNSFDITPQNDTIDGYVMGFLRRGELTFGINFVPTDATQDHLTGLYFSLRNKNKDGFRITFPDTSVWIVSGFVANIAPTVPVEGGIAANVTIRPSGAMMMLGVTIQ
jgi:hypothetical protein